MSQHPTIDLLRRGYEAFAAADFDALAEIIPEDAVWHVPAPRLLAGEYRGRDAVFAYFVRTAELTGGTFKADPISILGDDHHGIALQYTTSTVNGTDLKSVDVLAFRIEDGIGVEAWVLTGNAYEMDEALAR